MMGADDVRRDQAVFAAGDSGFDPGDFLDTLEDLSGIDLEHFCEPDDSGDLGEDLALGVLGGQGGGDLTRDLTAAFAYTAQDHLQRSRGSRRTQAPQVRVEKSTAKFTEEDWAEGLERDAFLIMRTYAEWLFGRGKKRFHAALKWFFGEAGVDSNPVTFELCCRVLECRPDVFRLRIQYEWYRGPTVFSGPMHFHAVPVPDAIEGHILSVSDQTGYACAREAWYQPGIRTEELISRVMASETARTHFVTREGEVVEALMALEEEMLLSEHHGWFCTGRNPLALQQRRSDQSMAHILTAGHSVRWSSLFGVWG
jgi:hypothetical protein